MKHLSLIPYLICGAVVTGLGIFAIPFIDVLSMPGTSYAAGLASPFTYFYAFLSGASFAFYLWRCDRRATGRKAGGDGTSA